ncbi:MAG: hypothetical protein OXN89_21825 [Bryobacterales bacterium]|nr:hypothetical protein [Bryobacterales bacterium]
MRRWAPRLATATLLIGSLVCTSPSHSSQLPNIRTVTFDFHHDPQGFVGGFADYPPAHAQFYELDSGHRTLPPPLESRSGLFLSGVNQSSDLFMFFKGPIGGLQPGGLYNVAVSLEIATDTPAGCVGAGGPPGESVYVKAGVTAVEPLPVREGSYLRMNVDIGNQSRSGAHAEVLGNVANSRNCEQPPRWELKSFDDHPGPTTIAVPADGRVWLLLGTDSGFAGRTKVFFTRASVAFTRVDASRRGSCAENFVTARTMRARADLPAFVRCAADYAREHGEAEARRAFHDDLRWKSGQTHVFVHGLEPSASRLLTHVLPPDPSREGTVLERSIDKFGTDYSFELHRLISLVDEGWIYHALTDPVTGLWRPKSSYVMKIDWKGDAAVIGATYYAPDLPGTCAAAEVNAVSLGEAPSDEELRTFVRCAALQVEVLGYFAWPGLSKDPRWNYGPIYVFGVNAETGVVEFSGSDSMFTFSGRIPELFGGRDMLRAAAEFGEAYWYYSVANPETGADEPMRVFVKLVQSHGVPLLVGSGYSPSAGVTAK